MYTAAGTDAFGGSGFTASGLTVGSTGAAISRSRSPDTRAFSSDIVLVEYYECSWDVVEELKEETGQKGFESD
jgi:hypothetical protein